MVTDFTPASTTFLAIYELNVEYVIWIPTRSFRSDLPISTPRPFMPTIKTFDAAMRFIATITRQKALSQYNIFVHTFMTEHVAEDAVSPEYVYSDWVELTVGESTSPRQSRPHRRPSQRASS